MTNKTVLILNGPGLEGLGDYDGNSYGKLGLDRIRTACSDLCNELGIKLDFRQTDDEEKMFKFIAKDSEDFDALIINPVDHSHATTVDFEMYRSAIKMITPLNKPVIEVHIQNIFNPNAETTKPLQVPEGEMGFICGLGVSSYLLAIRAVHKRFSA